MIRRWRQRQRLIAAMRRDLSHVYCGCDLHHACKCATGAAS